MLSLEYERHTRIRLQKHVKINCIQLTLSLSNMLNVALKKSTTSSVISRDCTKKVALLLCHLQNIVYQKYAEKC
jgi:hypothetical protein